VIDSALVMLAVGLSIWVLHIDLPMLTQAERVLLLLSPLIAVSLFYLMGLYEAVLRYLSFKAVFTVLKSVSLFGLVWAFGVWLLTDNLSSATPFLMWVFLLVLIGGSRFLRSWQFAYYGDGYGLHKERKNVLIYGAGTAGVQLATLLSYGNKHIAHAFIDDSPNLQDRVVEGHKVYSSKHIQHLIDKYKIDEVLMAIPSASRGRRKRILSELEPFRVHVRSLPSLEEIVNCEVKIDDIREVDMMDLLGRDPVPADSSLLDPPIEQKVVMVTGAAGSIGSELCRQIASYNPASLIMLDRTEKNLYDIEMDMRRNFSYIKYFPVLGDIRHKAEIEGIFEKYRPDVVFHAAAYKHVSMMEINPWEAVYNNILGTKNVVETACDFEIERFVLVSTDKAVNPTNVMGASKRVTEHIMQAHVNQGSTKFMTVRFGNVVGSSGSVIPLFKKQIEQGGPVTVTHPEVTRYFMTISEAVQLILQAGAMGKGGEIFVLDMGIQVKIVDMARDLIRLSGFEPERDIEIKFTRLGPGEKLYEELIVVGEEIAPTRHDKILVLNHSGTGNLKKDDLEKNIGELVKLADARDAEGIKNKLKEIVPEYMPFERRK